MHRNLVGRIETSKREMTIADLAVFADLTGQSPRDLVELIVKRGEQASVAPYGGDPACSPLLSGTLNLNARSPTVFHKFGSVAKPNVNDTASERPESA